MNAKPFFTALGIATALVAGANTAQAQVGIDSLQAKDVPVTLVYPTAEKSRPIDMGPFTIDVAIKAPAAPGRHRLIVMSHGAGGSALADHALAADFARAGFVVAQPLHVGDNFQNQRLSGPPSFRRRPGEVIQVIDALAADPQWAPLLDLSRVGVHGMSAGGVTGLSLAGAQWRMLNLVQHCSANLDADMGFCLQGAASPERQAARRASFNGPDNAPETSLPPELTAWHGGVTPSADQPDPRPDPRVAAVTLAVPVSAIFSAESLARIQIPVGIVGAQDDLVLEPLFHADHVLWYCTPCTRLIDLPNAGHFDLLWPWPAAVAKAVGAMQPRGGFPNPAFDPSGRASAREKIVDFHLTHLQASAPPEPGS